MLAIIIVVASFSFQISGAIILLLWSIGNCNKKIEKMCVENDSSHWYDMDNTTLVSKEELQRSAKTLYLNICAFADILIGYTCAVFVEDTGLSPWYIFGLVLMATLVILLVNITSSSLVAKIKYPHSKKVKIES